MQSIILGTPFYVNKIIRLSILEMVGRVCEALLDQYFPGEQRSSLLDIERSASLALTFGHPLIAIGMMNCIEPK